MAAKVAREIAKAEREVKKEAREVYSHRAAKVKDVLHAPMVAMAILYPVVIGFTLQARGWHFSLAHPRPAGDDILRSDRSGPKGDGFGPNQWVTFSATVFIRTMFSFTSYTTVHAYLVAHMRIVSPDAPKLKAPFFWIAPLFFLWIGITYFITYASLSRYGAHIADWIAVVGFSVILVLITVLVTMAPLSTGKILKGLVVPQVTAPREQAAGQ